MEMEYSRKLFCQRAEDRAAAENTICALERFLFNSAASPVGPLGFAVVKVEDFYICVERTPQLIELIRVGAMKQIEQALKQCEKSGAEIRDLRARAGHCLSAPATDNDPARAAKILATPE
jgi:hypothetical protein